MKITQTTNGDQVLVAVEGSLDSSESHKLENVLNDILNGKRVNLVIDFSKLEYLSSSGLRVLLGAQKMTNESIGNLVIKNVNPDIMEIFKLTGFSDFLNIESE